MGGEPLLVHNRDTQCPAMFVLQGCGVFGEQYIEYSQKVADLHVQWDMVQLGRPGLMRI